MYQYLSSFYDTWCSNKTPGQIIVQESQFIKLVSDIGYTEEEIKSFLQLEANKSFTTKDS
jgi:hypothetical protein